MSEEKRAFNRADRAVKVVATSDDAQVAEGTTLNVSLNGLSVRCESPLPVGAECDVILHLGDKTEGARATVLRHHDEGMILKFNDLSMRGFAKLNAYTRGDDED